jgi:acyl-CoA thioesterase FadM
MLIASFFKPRVANALDETSLRFSVWPNDLDLNGHMNNGRYLTIMDIGRMDFVIRLRLAGYVIKNSYIPVLSSASMRYRLPLLPFQKYALKTRIVCWDDKWVFMEHRFIIIGGKKDGAVAAVGLVKGSFFSKKTRGTIPTGEIMQAIGLSQDSPAMPEYIAHWQQAEETLREDMKQQQ